MKTQGETRNYLVTNQIAFGNHLPGSVMEYSKGVNKYFLKLFA